VIGLTGLLDRGPADERPADALAPGRLGDDDRLDLTMDLAPRRHDWLPGASLHGLDFDY
jgi:hypothetical protein